MRILILTLALLLASLPAAADSATARTVTASGDAVVSVTPDMARINFSVSAVNPVSATAQRQVAEVTARFLDLMDDLDIDEANVRTTGARLSPQYKWNREERKLTGYLAERNLQVTLDDLDRLGELIEKAVAAGVNNVSPPALDSSQRPELNRQALNLAAEDARLTAEGLATVMGAKLGPVRTITAGRLAPAPVMRAAAVQMESMDAAGTYETGDIEIRASATVSFDLIVD